VKAARERARTFLVYGFAVSVVAHLIVLPFVRPFPPISARARSGHPDAPRPYRPRRRHRIRRRLPPQRPARPCRRCERCTRRSRASITSRSSCRARMRTPAVRANHRTRPPAASAAGPASRPAMPARCPRRFATPAAVAATPSPQPTRRRCCARDPTSPQRRCAPPSPRRRPRRAVGDLRNGHRHRLARRAEPHRRNAHPKLAERRAQSGGDRRGAWFAVPHRDQRLRPVRGGLHLQRRLLVAIERALDVERPHRSDAGDPRAASRPSRRRPGDRARAP